VLLLHGFPDSALLWRHQVAALTGAGFRVIAPDLRGFGASDAPDGVEAYGLATVVGDVLGILDVLSVERVHVVGHDWGAAAAWGLAALRPDLVERLVALSVGHPAGFLAEPRQRQLSWYMLFFQFEGVAEEALRRDDWRLFRETFGDEGDLEQYVEDLSRPGRLTAALNWYRANVSPESFGGGGLAPLPAVRCPTLGGWGAADPALAEGQMVASAVQVEGPWRYERVEDAGHWIPVAQPERLNELLVAFLTGPA
jgi:pimeloyl-ACP methyl ester carboxylesterase